VGCSSCWNYFKKNFDLVDLTPPSVLPYVEAESSYEKCFSEKFESLEFHKRRDMPNLYLSLLTTLWRSQKPLSTYMVVERASLTCDSLNFLRERAVSKHHAELKWEKGRKYLLLTEKGKECVELFFKYVTRFDLQPLI